MRRSLILLLVVVAFAAATRTVQAADLIWSSGISITEKTAASGVFSHIDMYKNGQIVGSWFSTSGQLPILSMQFQYVAYIDLPGFRHTERVVLSPDGGGTQWEATYVIGKGWRVGLPMGSYQCELKVQKERIVSHHGPLGIGHYKAKEKYWATEVVTKPGLQPGGYGLEFAAVTQDKQNTLTIIIPLATWLSNRRSAAGDHTMVQAASFDFDSLNNKAKVAYLRDHGFVEAWDEPSMSVMAAQQMLQAPSQPATQPIQAPTPQPPIQPKPTVAPTPPSPLPSPTQPVVTQPQKWLFVVQSQGQTVMEMEVTYAGVIKPQGTVNFTRSGRVVAKAKITCITPGNVTIDLVPGKEGPIQEGDQFEIEEEVG